MDGTYLGSPIKVWLEETERQIHRMSLPSRAFGKGGIMEVNTQEGKTFHMGEFEFEQLVKGFIKSYQFHNGNESPKTITIPAVFKVDGVEVVFPIKTVRGASSEAK